MRITRAVVPSLFTVLNMFSGFLSIIHSSRGEFVPACWFIVLAAGFDALDGVMARLTKSSSAFGVEIDSLSDVVSFGAAPAFMVYQVQLHGLEAFGILRIDHPRAEQQHGLAARQRPEFLHHGQADPAPDIRHSFL